MNLDKFLNVLATVFGALGSIYVMYAILAMSPDLMAEQASTKWNFNAAQIEALASQKGDNVAGIVFVVVAFALATVTLVFVPEGVRVFQKRLIALALIAVLSGGLYLSLSFISQAISHHQKLAIAEVFAARCLDEILKRRRLEAWDEPSIRVHADLLELHALAEEPIRAVLGRVAARIGKVLPPDLDFSAVEPRK